MLLPCPQLEGGRVTNCPGLPSSDLVLALKVQHLGKPLSPWQIGTVGHLDVRQEEYKEEGTVVPRGQYGFSPGLGVWRRHLSSPTSPEDGVVMGEWLCLRKSSLSY